MSRPTNQRRVLVIIKLDEIRTNLSAADGECYGDDEVRKWLRDAGFEPAGEIWSARQEDLSHLSATEVHGIIPVPD